MIAFGTLLQRVHMEVIRCTSELGNGKHLY